MLTSKCPGLPNATDQIGGNLKVFVKQSHQSPLRRVASQSSQSAIYTGPTGGRESMLGHINQQLMEELGCSKRLTGDGTIMNSQLDNVENIHSNNCCDLFFFYLFFQ